jgi:hypothetical protein
MPMYSVHMKHSVESCPMFNKENKIIIKELSSKKDDFARKEGIKVITGVFSPLEHTILYVVEAPSQDAVIRYFKEIGFAFYNKIEIKHVKSMEDALERM